jgi:AmmeMemoRadiSam system protein B/AmmeMemoRadiSam system protein A
MKWAGWLGLLLIFCGALIAFRKDEKMKSVMVSPLSGQWFPASESGLRDDLSERLRGITLVRKQNICAAVVPHAGYRYSGAVAGGVYLRIDPKTIKRIVVMGPSHYVSMHNQVSIPDATHFRTPLGDLAVDTAFVDQLRKLPFIITDPRAHQREHSDQIQLPLIQYCLSTKIPVVCMVCGQFDSKHLVEAATAMQELLDEGTFFVASSDFTHYGASYGFMPFTQDVEKNIETLDMGVFELFMRKDFKGFLKYLDETGATVCGRDPLAFLIAMMPKDAIVQKTAYDTSGKMLHDRSNSVSYIGAIVSGNWPSASGTIKKEQSATEQLDKGDCDKLLSLVRNTLEQAFKHGEPMALARVPPVLTSGMQSIRGGFVTLTLDGDLRGCIGEIMPRREIWKAVREQALNAAFHDTRFEPLSTNEFALVKIEISILTPLRPVPSWKDIEIGKHGILLTISNRSAVFLPQVAPEQGWGLEETLNHLAMKAGLPREAWRDKGATFLVFEAQVIHE